jgi:hypothetical protein
MTPIRVSLLLGLVCLVAGWQVAQIPQSAIEMAVGPSLMPALIVAGLSLVSLLYGISAYRGLQSDDAADPEHAAVSGSTTRLLFLLGAGVVFIGLVGLVGFIPSAILCGVLIARAFDAPINLKSFLICGAIVIFFWFLFSKILGIGLGPALTMM